jgi:hypothetical protein
MYSMFLCFVIEAMGILLSFLASQNHKTKKVLYPSRFMSLFLKEGVSNLLRNALPLVQISVTSEQNFRMAEFCFFI